MNQQDKEQVKGGRQRLGRPRKITQEQEKEKKVAFEKISRDAKEGKEKASEAPRKRGRPPKSAQGIPAAVGAKQKTASESKNKTQHVKESVASVKTVSSVESQTATGAVSEVVPGRGESVGGLENGSVSRSGHTTEEKDKKEDVFDTSDRRRGRSARKENDKVEMIESLGVSHGDSISPVSCSFSYRKSILVGPCPSTPITLHTSVLKQTSPLLLVTPFSLISWMNLLFFVFVFCFL
ncbi:hypothetical protein BDF14DRAFT_1757855 [Spinellus fusiger]|nr:hypothetical protein BDF14DRAFT_1757855 [Spinellus fusiger]